MKLSSYLDKNFIFKDLSGDNKKEVIENFVNKIIERDSKLDKNIVLKALLSREEVASTAMGNSVAIPHARIENYDNFLFAVGKTKSPITCKIMNGNTDKVRIFFLLIAPQLKNRLMLKVLSGVSKLITAKEYFNKILESNSENEIYELIKNAGIEIGERITAIDLVNKEIQPVNLDDTLQIAAKRLVAERLSGLPVVDDLGRFVGEITEKHLIKIGMPKYVSFVDDLNFMTISEPFEEFFKKEKTMKVDEIYNSNPEIIRKDTPVLQIASLMIKKGITRLYVVENDEFLGMIVRSDLITKVLHA